MSRTKVLAAVVVALALVFFVGIGAGAVRRDGAQAISPQGEATPLDWIRRKVGPDDLEAACLNRARRELSIAVGQTCTVRVPGSWYPVRRLTLQLKGGTAAAVTMKQKGSLTEKRSLAGGKSVALDLFSEATVVVSCVGPGTAACAVGVE